MPANTSWMSWGRLTRGQRIALVVMILAAVNVPVRYLIGATDPQDHVGYSVFFLIVAAIVFLRPRFQALLWRVRNRLLFTYVLVGVVPILLIALLLSYSSKILLGQYAGDRVREAIDDQAIALASLARSMAVAASASASASTPMSTDAPARDAMLNALREQTPGVIGGTSGTSGTSDSSSGGGGVRAIVRLGDRIVRMPEDGELKALPTWSTDGFSGVLMLDGRPYVAAQSGGSSGAAAVTVFTYQPLSGDALTTWTRGAVLVAIAEENVHVRIDLGKNRVFLRKNGVESPLEATQSIALPPPRGFWDGPVVWILPIEGRAAASGERGGVTMALLSRPSLLFARLFGSLGQFGVAIAILLAALAIILLLVEIAAVIWSVRLTRTVTRAVHDLYEATRQIAAGNLAHRAPIRAHDQLSELAGSFNGMTDRLTRLIEDVRDKEKLESELAIARRVQIELFPKALPKLGTLELAGLCVPSRFVSGDYYDVVRLDDRWTAIALGDISGKGIAAALVMASVQSALHAQLKFTGAPTPPAAPQNDSDSAPSTATWMARISEQIYENTPPEKYATFFCAAYDDQHGRLVYTNAGHLPPLLIRDGKTIALEPTGMVIGLLPVFSYEQHVIDLKPGDLLAAYTDGITEAENAAAEQFEAKRLTDLLIQHADKPLDDIIHIVTEHVRTWAHNPESQDDITILLARKR